MAERSETLLKSADWFSNPPSGSEAAPPSPWIGWLIGCTIALLVMRFHSLTMGCVILAVASVISVASLRSTEFHQWLTRFFRWLGTHIGNFLSVVVLTPLFLIGFTIVRLLMRLSGQDPLRLRARDDRTFWLASDTERRKLRYTRSMFATDPPGARRGGLSLMKVAALGIGLLIAGELILRFLGYGNAVLYTADPSAGYIPAPNQTVNRFGGLVQTNGMGMRAPDFTEQKPAEAVRILLLGDSTLYGGQYVKQQDLYARRLQEHLQAMTSKQVEVLNMGVNGWGPFNKIGYVETRGIHNADLCVICMPLVDLRRPLVSIWDTPYFRDDAPPRLAYEEVLQHLSWRQRRDSRRKQLTQVDNVQQRIQEGIECYVELAKLVKSKGCEVRFEILPAKWAATTETVPPPEVEMMAKFKQHLDTNGFSFGYPAHLFVGHPDVDKLYHDRVHLNPLGHRGYADYLAKRIAEADIWKSLVTAKESE